MRKVVDNCAVNKIVFLHGICLTACFQDIGNHSSNVPRASGKNGTGRAGTGADSPYKLGQFPRDLQSGFGGQSALTLHREKNYWTRQSGQRISTYSFKLHLTVFSENWCIFGKRARFWKFSHFWKTRAFHEIHPFLENARVPGNPYFFGKRAHLWKNLTLP